MELIYQSLFQNYEGAGKASVFKANQDRKIHLSIDENEINRDGEKKSMVYFLGK